jgi:hypothetical protein
MKTIIKQLIETTVNNGIPERFKPIIKTYLVKCAEHVAEEGSADFIFLTSMTLEAIVDNDVSELSGQDVVLSLINMTDHVARVIQQMVESSGNAEQVTEPEPEPEPDPRMKNLSDILHRSTRQKTPQYIN